MAKTVNLGDKYEHRITLRLSDKQYKFLIDISRVLGVSPSDYIRMVVNAGMYNSNLEKVGTQENEDVKTNSNDKL